MLTGFDGLVARISPDENDNLGLLRITASNLSSFIMSSFIKSEKRTDELMGKSYGLLLNAEIFRAMAEAISLLDPQGKHAADGFRKYADLLEFSHIINKTVGSSFNNALYPKKATAEHLADISRQRIQILAESVEDKSIKNLLQQAQSMRLADVISKKYPFYEKSPARILANGLVYSLSEIKRMDCILAVPREEALADKCVSEAAENYSCAHGLRLASGMYASLAGLLRKYPEFAFLTEDSSAEDAAKTAEKLSNLFSYSCRLSDMFVKQSQSRVKNMSLPSEVNLNLAEEVGPACLRRKIISYPGEIPEELGAVLSASYEAVPFKEVQDRITRYTTTDYFLNKESQVKFMEDFLAGVNPAVEEAQRYLSGTPEEGQVTVKDVEKFLEEFENKNIKKED